jgi:ABC-type nitrate/sulfonate/bicarbonate transport system permease component
MKRAWLIGILILIALWYLVTVTGLIERVFLPSPIAVFKKLCNLVFSAAIFGDLVATLWRTMLGFFMGCILGVCAGLIMGNYRLIYQTMEFPVEFFRSIPATALFPLFIVIWGLGNQVKIFIAAWASSMVVLINTIYGMQSVSATRLMVAKTKKLSRFKTFYKVMIPDALPYIIAGARIGLSLAIVVEIVAEMFLGSYSGLGHRIFNATSVFEMEEAYATVFVVGILGYLLNKTIILIEKKVVHWTGR